VTRLLAALVGLGLLLGACSSTSDDLPTGITTTTRPRADAPVTTVPGAPPLAVVLGDSNTLLSARAIRKAIAGTGLTPDVRGILGSGVRDDLRDWFPAAAAIGKARPAVVVVALGTNDAVFAEDAQAFPDRAELLLQTLGDAPVIWVTHHASDATRDPANEQRINDAIRALPATHPNVTVLDLAPFLPLEPGLISPDGIHYSESGQKWFADHIAEAAAARVEQ
jgi:lysophospholipase L1-like esterase